MLNMQNVKDIEITEGKVRTIHDKDNRLIWGRLAYDTKYAGDTFQQTYSGKNLLAGNYGTSTHQGIEHSWNNVYVTLSGTTSASYTNLTSDINAVISAGTYTFSSDKVSQFRRYIRVRYDSANHDYYIGVGETSVSFTIPNDATDAVIKLFYIGSLTVGMQISETFGLMLESGSSASPFEPYTAGPAPNPDYPQPIQVVTGEQTVTINDGGGQSATYKVGLTGKNLFNCPSTAKTTANTVFTKIDSNSFRTDFTKTTTTMQSSFTQIRLLGLLPNTTYTISYSSEVTGDTYNRAGQFRMHIGNTWSNYYSGSATFTTPSDVSSVYFVPANAQDVTTPGSNSVVFRNVQVDLGSSATTYEPYYNYELCKIGTYQDYIYKSGDDWYVHKEVDKYVFDGDESWSTTPYGTNSWILSNVIYFNFVSNKIQIMSNIATGIAHADRNTTTPNVMYSGQNNVFNYRNTSFTTLSALQTATKDSYVYYAIANPTDTKITDATLVGQLNAVHEWLTRYGYNATVTGTLPIIINQTNL